MIMVGANIVSAADPLKKVQEDYFYHSLINPKPAIEAKIRQLRVAYQIDPKQYAKIKRTLPYIVCGMFNPPFRRTENFAYAENFIIDIDHLATKGMSVKEVKSRVQQDDRVLMAFASPSEDGLKVMFRLRERCYDAGTFSIFYKEFLRKFSLQYGLEQVADARTSDVTRACFVSVDKEAFYNVLANPIDMTDFIDMDNPLAMLDLKNSQDKEEHDTQKQQHEEERESHVSEPDNDVMARVKEVLKLNKAKSEQKKVVYVPEKLVEIIDDLKKHVEITGLVVSEIINIQYGKKIRIKMGRKEAEINLFYGKKGFSVVKSPRCGTDEELNDVCAQLIKDFIDMQ